METDWWGAQQVLLDAGFTEAEARVAGRGCSSRRSAAALLIGVLPLEAAGLPRMEAVEWCYAEFLYAPEEAVEAAAYGWSPQQADELLVLHLAELGRVWSGAATPERKGDAFVWVQSRIPAHRALAYLRARFTVEGALAWEAQREADPKAADAALAALTALRSQVTEDNG